jgi:hypothetical protein
MGRDSQEAFRIAYQAASQPNAKRDLTIKAIDDGVISLGLELSDAKRMFGDTLHVEWVDKTDPNAYRTIATVMFGQVPSQPIGTKVPAQVVPTGWYMSLRFLNASPGSDVLVNYSFSGVWKPSP